MHRLGWIVAAALIALGLTYTDASFIEQNFSEIETAVDALEAAPPAHATSHQDGGADEVATATPAADAIPKAGAGSTLADGWISESNVTQHQSAVLGTLPLFDVLLDFASPFADADEWVRRTWPAASTIAECTCEVYNGTSIELRLCLGEDTGDDTCTTQIASLTCDTTGAQATGLSQNLTAGEKVTLVVVDGTNTGSVSTAEYRCTGTLQ